LALGFYYCALLVDSSCHRYPSRQVVFLPASLDQNVRAYRLLIHIRNYRKEIVDQMAVIQEKEQEIDELASFWKIDCKVTVDATIGECWWLIISMYENRTWCGKK